MGVQGGCERRIEVFVRNQNKRKKQLGAGGSGRGVRGSGWGSG